MKIALTMMKVEWEDKEANLHKAEALIRQAALAGARMIIFPEMSFTGFSMNVDQIGEWPEGYDTQNALHDIDAPKTMQILRDWSSVYQITIVFGHVVKEQEQNGHVVGKNTLTVVSQGQVLAQYEKLHPFGYAKESSSYRAGDHLTLCEIEQIPFAFFICYDLRFPEIFQLVSNQAKAIIVIANWPKNRQNHWELLLRARAVENQAFCIGVNRAGSGDGLEYAKSSMAFDPTGERLPEESCDKGACDKASCDKGACGYVSGREGGCYDESYTEELCMIEIDPALADRYRQSFPLKMDRRDAFYGSQYQLLRAEQSAQTDQKK
ncbi:MAG: carbon-nitrogen family hydrolase [Clostridium sp.]|jgi:predicted amidohydrolase|nr:carbon-nitrogen family hydrolase [Clostridium sp.]